MASTRAISDLALSDTGFVFDPATGATFTVNATGLAVLRALAEGQSLSTIEGKLAERFDLRGADVARDVADFVEVLRQQGLMAAKAGAAR